MFVDDLPVSSYVGDVYKTEGSDNATVAIYTHKKFVIEYNGDRIISVQLQGDKLVELKNVESMELQFTYGVEWRETKTEFADRFELLLATEFFEAKVHWLSIFSSFMMVLFLTGLVSIILLRTIKSDYARYDREEGLTDFDRDFGDDYGWKQVHADVFRQPPRLMLLSAFMGTGSQLVILAAVVILYTIMGDLYAERATILTATVFLYALTSAISGYTSAKYYAHYNGKDWVKNVILTATLWPGTVACIGGIINSIAIYYSSSRAIAFPIILAMLAIWTFLCFPLTLLGAIVGRNWGKSTDFPCRVNPIPRPIPEKVWYAEPMALVKLHDERIYLSIRLPLLSVLLYGKNQVSVVDIEEFKAKLI
ncbi:Transmembrane 9 super member 3 [Apophysomyces ossiformis]|uniref:Transmembrane 9 superfamily member n=1 Tax=Apophysomyces ossiformis TaxID=679940 RepID=A0A8H7BHT0_9FUNG|nr:Transmembrane 9 super member 3 [Apophysomyces ossiformis]